MVEFIDDLIGSVKEIYRSKNFPVTFLIGFALVGAVINQWVLGIIGLGGFLFFQFFKRER
jgi:hypothetical protein